MLDLLHKLTEKSNKFVWTEECDEAFKSLKQNLVEAPILAHPDFSQSFILDCDASNDAIGGVLSQKINGDEHVIAYASRTLSKSERRYCVTRKELLALVHFVKYFRHYLYGKKFLVRTDHGSLRWLMNFKNPEGQVARWLEILSSYEMKIEHRPGRLHKNADALSRKSCKQCGLDCEIPEKNSKCVVAGLGQIDEGLDESEHRTLRTAQENDEDISKIKDCLKQGCRPENGKIQEYSYFLKSLFSQWERLDIQNQLLVRKWNEIGTNIIKWQAIVPLSERRNVLRYSHDIKVSGHLGIKKTLNKIRQRYYWPGLQIDVKAYVSGCEICSKRKGPKQKIKAPMQITRSGFPMERIAVDILGELPTTEKGNKYILVISDYFTKWTESFPMPNMEAATVAEIMVQHVISRFGVPEKNTFRPG